MRRSGIKCHLIPLSLDYSQEQQADKDKRQFSLFIPPFFGALLFYFVRYSQHCCKKEEKM